MTLIFNACHSAKHQFKDNECIQMSISHNEKKYDIIFERAEVEKELSEALFNTQDRLDISKMLSNDSILDYLDAEYLAALGLNNEIIDKFEINEVIVKSGLSDQDSFRNNIAKYTGKQTINIIKPTDLADGAAVMCYSKFNKNKLPKQN